MTDQPPQVGADLDRLEPAPIDEAAEDRAIDQATLYLRAIRSIDRQVRRVADQYAEQRRPIDEDLKALDEWRDDRMHGLVTRRQKLVSLLEGFGRAYKSRYGRAPSRMPYGRISLTPPKDSLVVTDNDAFVDWAEGTDRIGLVRYVKAPDKDACKAALKPAGDLVLEHGEPDKRYRVLTTPDGEPVPGIALATPTEDSASVKVDE